MHERGTMTKDIFIRLDRRQFTFQAALLALSSVTITISGCGGSSNPGGGTPPPPSGDKVGQISANHGHTAVITAAQAAAGGAVDLNIQGSSGHPHHVLLSGAEVIQIAGGTRVTKVSSNDDGHTHEVTFN